MIYPEARGVDRLGGPTMQVCTLTRRNAKIVGEEAATEMAPAAQFGLASGKLGGLTLKVLRLICAHAALAAVETRLLGS